MHVMMATVIWNRVMIALVNSLLQFFLHITTLYNTKFDLLMKIGALVLFMHARTIL